MAVRTCFTRVCLTSVLLAFTATGAGAEECHTDGCIYTSLSYGGVGVAGLMEDPSLATGVMASALTFLTVGSLEMHRTRDWGRWPAWEGVDLAAMHATYAALAVHAWGAPWWAMLGASAAAPALLEVKWDMDVKTAMGAYMVATTLAGVRRREWKKLVVGLGLMGAGLAVREDGDMGHTLWHLLTAGGTRVLYRIGAGG